MADSISPVTIQPQTQTGAASFVRNNATMIALIAIPTTLIAGYFLYNHFYGERNVTQGNPTPTGFATLDDNISIEDLKTKLSDFKLEDIKKFINDNPTSVKYTKAVAVALTLETDENAQIELASIDQAGEALGYYEELKDEAAAKDVAIKTANKAVNDSNKAVFKSASGYKLEDYYSSLNVPYDSICKMHDENELGDLLNALKNFPDSEQDHKPFQNALESGIKLHFTDDTFGKTKMPNVLKANEDLRQSALKHLEHQANSRTGWEFAEFSDAYPDLNKAELEKLIQGENSNYSLSDLTIALAFPKLSPDERKELLPKLHSKNSSFAENMLYCIKDSNDQERIELYLNMPGRKWNDLMSMSHGLTLEQMHDHIQTIKDKVDLDKLNDEIKKLYQDKSSTSPITAYILGLLVAKDDEERRSMLKGAFGTTFNSRTQAFDQYCELMDLENNDATYDFVKDLLNNGADRRVFNHALQTLNDHYRLTQLHAEASDKAKKAIIDVVPEANFKTKPTA